MKYDPPLVPGRLVRRYKRFLSDVRLGSGEVIVAHCPNPGSMLSVNVPEAPVWLWDSASATRKLRYTWELIEIGGAVVGINTSRPNRLVEAAIAAGAIPELTGYPTIRREVAYGEASRVDLVLEAPDRPPCYVEIKSVTMRRGTEPGSPAEFPDAVTTRGARHLEELSAVVRAGKRAVAFYLVQRPDCERLTIAHDIDPTYADGLFRAMRAGVEVLVYRCDISPAGIEIVTRLELDPVPTGDAAPVAVGRRRQRSR
ncbi:MAG: DNA/RNA nuclease SfsA [Rhodospirillales bacterium]|nr:DNA/RNA nuclease SfsA [Rhodospirillales bacterium]